MPTIRASTFAITGLIEAPRLFAHKAQELAAWAEKIAALLPTHVWHYSEPNTVAITGLARGRTENFLEALPEFRALLQSPPLADLLTEILQDEPVVFKDKMNYKMRGNHGFEAHQDIQAGWQSYADYFVTVGIAVDAQLAEGGCIEFMPDNFGYRLVGKLWQPLQENEVDFNRFEPYPCAPGDVLIFDGCVPHRSKPNMTADSQRIFYITFNRKSAGDFRARYFADKFKGYPPDNYRNPETEYAYKV